MQKNSGTSSTRHKFVGRSVCGGVCNQYYCLVDFWSVVYEALYWCVSAFVVRACIKEKQKKQ
jgi:hypothetical protein